MPVSFAIPTPPGECNRNHHLLSRHRFWLISLLAGLSCFASSNPVQAADRIFVAYGILERSIPVASLENYARTGFIDDDLAVYAQFAKPAELAQLRTALVSRAELSPVAISQFLYSPQGETLLRRIGQVIQTESRVTGFNAIRAALILAAADREGLTLLNVLRKFPTRGLRIDVQQSLEIVSALEGVVNQTNRATRVITQEAAAEIASQPAINTTDLEDLRSRGLYTWRKQTLTLVDLSRSTVSTLPGSTATQEVAVTDSLPGRIIPVDIYLPVEQPQPAPVVVISHGLGSDRNTFLYLAQQLTSYGFAVLVPEHPGSNAKQMQALLNGTANEVAEPAEFVNRPLDITFVLNELDRQSAYNPTLQGKLNLKQVGVIGQSFGGYTALALAGAPINVEQLKLDCQDLDTGLNLSLLLQCRALQLGQSNSSLQDPRVRAVFVINPIASAVFGQASLSQIKIPVLVVTGNADTVAPALVEQIEPFTWLTTASKYLVMLDRGTHFSALDALADQGGALQLPEEVIGPNPAIARRYMNALSVAFFQSHVAERSSYANYLTAAYMQSISEYPMVASLITSLTPEQLTKGIASRPSTSQPRAQVEAPNPLERRNSATTSLTSRNSPSTR